MMSRRRRTSVPVGAMRMLSSPPPGVRLVGRGAGILVARRALAGVGPLAVKRQTQPIDFVIPYLTAAELLGRKPTLAAIKGRLENTSFENCLLCISRVLAAVESDPQDMRLQANLALELVQGDLGRRMAGICVEKKRPWLTRQGILAALKVCVRAASDRPGEERWEVGDLGLSLLEINDLLGTVVDPPAALTLEVLQNTVFNHDDNLHSLIGRHHWLWQDLPARLKNSPDHVDVSATFESAFGIPLDQFVALGFWFLSHFTDAKEAQGGLQPFSPKLGKSPLSRTDLDRFIASISADRAWHKEQIEAEESGCGMAYSFTGFRKRPLIRWSRGLLPSSLRFLAESFTSGVFFRIFNYLHARDEQAWKRWTRFYGKLIEAYARKLLDSMLGGPGVTSSHLMRRILWEEDLQALYPDRKVTDAVLVYPEAILPIEVVSSRPGVKTLVAGELSAFMADLEKVVFKKIRQIESIVEIGLRTPGALGGIPGHSLAIRPVLVVGHAFPMMPGLAREIREGIRKDSPMRDPRVSPLEILSLDDLERLARYSSAGVTIAEILARKQKSSLVDVSIANFLWSADLIEPGRSAVLDEGYKRATDQMLRVLFRRASD